MRAPCINVSFALVLSAKQNMHLSFGQLTSWNLLVTIYTTLFTIQKLCVVPTHCLYYVFRMLLCINAEYFPIWRAPLDFCNEDAVFSVRYERKLMWNMNPIVHAPRGVEKTDRLTCQLQTDIDLSLQNINPLTPELNPSAQCYLTRFFTGDFASWTVHFVNICVKNNEHHVTRHNTPIHNILSTASQFSISQKALETLPEDGNVMPKHVGAIIHN
jgi:hypothetical protein